MDAAAALASICGPGNAGPCDIPVPWDDPRPSLRAAPATTGEAAAVLCAARDFGLSVVFRGAGTKLAWGSPPARCDLLVDTGRMDAVIEHDPGDLILRVQAGAPLARVQEVVAKAGQQLAIDEVVPGSTIGGVVATGLSGPRRMLYGAPRDLVLGMTVVRADGTAARSGGRVVKNVAGYDLGKLFAGAFGTLGLIAEVTLRLHPLPAASATVSAALPTAELAARAGRTLAASQAVPAAVELSGVLGTRGPVTVSALVEGLPAGLPHRAEALAALLGPGATVGGPAPESAPNLPSVPGGALWKAAVAPGGLVRFLAGLDAQASRAGIPLALRGSAGSAVVFLGAAPDVPGEALAALLAGARALAAEADGTVVVFGPGPAAGLACPWGPVRGLDLMHRVKAQFDPEGRLAPGRFVGGI